MVVFQRSPLAVTLLALIGASPLMGAPTIEVELPDVVIATQPIEGTVFRDENANGVRDDGEAGWPGVGVSNGVTIAVTDADGRYRLEPSPDAMDVVFVNQPSDCRLTPAMYLAVREIEDLGAADFGLVPQEPDEGPLTFAQVSDVHVGRPEDFDRFLDALHEVERHPAPTAFTVATGDLVNRAGRAGQMETYAAVSALSERPWMHVFGNHDTDVRGEGVRVYRHFLGPDYYSFDRGDVHFVARNAILPTDVMETWIEEDLRLFGEGKTVVVLQHYPPTSEERHRRLHGYGARAVVSGHWHSTRITEFEGMLSINSPTFMMGAIDVSPAGFRLIRVDGDVITTRFVPGRTGRILTVQSPAETLEVRAPVEEVWAAVLDSENDVASASFAIEGTGESREGPMGAVSNLGHMGTFDALTEPGDYTVTLTATDGRGDPWSAAQPFEILEPVEDEEAPLTPWPMHMGGPLHHGETDLTFRTPMRLDWIATSGASIDFGSPVTDGERVYVGLRDRDNLVRNGVVAFDPWTGERLWWTPTQTAICHTVAVDGDRVYASDQAGRVYALNAATGDVVWTHDLGNDFQRWIYSAPALADGHLVCGSSAHLACLDPETGDEHWAISPGGEFISSHSSPAVADGVVVMGGVWQRYGGERGHALVALSLASGEVLWTGQSPGFHASPMIWQGRVHSMDIDGEFRVHDLHTGELLWSLELGGGWSTTTPALHAASGTAITATASGEVVAIDLEEQSERWRARSEVSRFRMSAYRPTFRSVFGSPTVAGDVVFIGSSDGELRALDVATGEERWHHDFGVPTVSTPCPSGDRLFTAALDGNLICLRSGSARRD